jgi:hypothetical protein
MKHLFFNQNTCNQHGVDFNIKPSSEKGKLEYLREENLDF